MRRVTLKVEGMKCGGCAGSVQSALEEVTGVIEVVVSHEVGEARLTVEDAVERSNLVAAIEAAGYTPA
jgi:copper chaperone CopZ